jgi:hypothetical protein
MKDEVSVLPVKGALDLLVRVFTGRAFKLKKKLKNIN